MGTHQYLYLLYAYRFVCSHLNTYIHFITLHCTTLQIQYVTLHCNIIHYITIQYITSHTYIHTYTSVYVYIYMSMFVSLYIYIYCIHLYTYIYIHIYLSEPISGHWTRGSLPRISSVEMPRPRDPDMWQGPANTLISNKCKDVELKQQNWQFESWKL